LIGSQIVAGVSARSVVAALADTGICGIAIVSSGLKMIYP